MRLPGVLGRWFTPITMDDPVFGHMKYSGGIWTGEAVFPDGGAPTQVLIQADENGPIQAQRGFFIAACGRFDSLREGVTSKLVEMAKDIVGDAPIELPTTSEEFAFDSVSIQSIDGPSVRWNLSFGWDVDPDWLLDIYMEDWRIVDTGLAH